ncbi:MAG: magnesium transporter CorA, partial [Mesorhizobium sp.]|nr:magnesium transporter CorA [Mesorhizobium sp.]
MDTRSSTPSGRTVFDDDSTGLVFRFSFGPDGARIADGPDTVWTWKSYSLTDARARRTLELSATLPDAARASVLSGSVACHIDFDEGWVYGETPDIRHEHYSETREVGYFRFAYDNTTLISGRRHPLRSVEAI